MSLVAKMEALSLGDDAAVIAAIKAEGVEKSGFATGIDTLKAKCASSVEAEALAGLALTKAIAMGCPEAEAFNKECLTACKYYSSPGNLSAFTTFSSLHLPSHTGLIASNHSRNSLAQKVMAFMFSSSRSHPI
jgi:hypothetical protein